MALPSVTYPLSKLQSRVSQGVLRADIAATSNNYADYINEGIREYENLKSWSFMKKTADITLLANELTVALPADFKEFLAQRDRWPVNLVLPDPFVPGIVKPCGLSFESPELQAIWRFNSWIATFGSHLTPMFALRRENDGYFLAVQTSNLQDLTLRINYYAYLPPLTNPTDTHPLSESYPAMVIAKAKALALAEVNDPVADALDQYAARKFLIASSQDNRSELIGRRSHM